MPFVCDLLDAQTRSVILVGHSSGGMIISAAAAARPDRVAALVYLAAFLLPPGVTPPAVMRDDDQSILAASLVVDRERQVVTVRPECAKAVFYADCSDADAAWATEMLVPEPLIATITGRLHLTYAAIAAGNKPTITSHGCTSRH